MTIIVPIAAGSFQSTTYTEFGTSPYVDVNDGDTSYAQFDPTTAGLAANYRLPATSLPCDDATFTITIVSRWVEGTGPDGFGTPTAYLRGNTSGIFFTKTQAEFFAEHHSYTYSTDVMPQEEVNTGLFPSLVTLLADGNLYITVNYQRIDFDTLDLRVTYAALEFDCGTVPPLRQNQRDDLRQNQRTSRQLTVRQRGYL